MWWCRKEGGNCLLQNGSSTVTWRFQQVLSSHVALCKEEESKRVHCLKCEHSAEFKNCRGRWTWDACLCRLYCETIQLTAASDHNDSELQNMWLLETAMKARFSPMRERALTVFKASVCVIVKFVCVWVCVCLLIGAWGRRCHSSCVNVCLACRTIVGKLSGDPRSCWKEMIGFGTRWPLCDRWLGAGLAQPKSPTHTYVGSQHHARTHVHIQEGIRNVHTCTGNVKTRAKRVCGLYLYMYLQ